MWKSLALIAVLSAVASAQDCGSCSAVLAYYSKPTDGSYPFYQMQCRSNAFTASEVSTAVGTTCSSGLTCGCGPMSTCNTNNQCSNLGCTTDNGGCSSICGYNSAGAVQCSCFAGTSLINNYQCNCGSFLPFPRSGWETASNYLCNGTGVASSSSSSSSGVVSVTSTSSSSGVPVSATTAQTATVVITGQSTTITADSRITVTLDNDCRTMNTTKYTIDLARFLSISASRVYVFSLTCGSSILDTGISAGSNGETSSVDALRSLAQSDTTALGNALGAPVKSLAVTGASSTANGQADAEINRNSDDGLSGGAIAGIVIGSVAFVVIIIAIALFFVMRKQNDRRRRDRADLPIHNNM